MGFSDWVSGTCKNVGDTTPQVTAMDSGGNKALMEEKAEVDQRCSMRPAPAGRVTCCGSYTLHIHIHVDTKTRAQRPYRKDTLHTSSVTCNASTLTHEMHLFD